ncbi:fimbria/pilus outer membrane usher protein [Halomonas sp. HNIBRBA4712]|uniref:fimbria/pilus outer membrane usher protein n=1 Tax=Halomonas sp. HNIBRBA4712 TaxID=3373087 RepID=UPI0037474991
MTPWLCALALLAEPAWAQRIPPLELPDDDAWLTYHLELVINQHPTGQVVPVWRQHDDYRLEVQTLIEHGLPIAFADERIRISELADVTATYDGPAQRLHLEVPAAWLPRQALGRQRQTEFTPAQTSQGALINYSAYAWDTEYARSASLQHELRLFGERGALHSSGIYRETFTGRGGDTGYRRFDTRWQYTDQQDLTTYELGDTLTRPTGWSNAVRLGGVSVSRDFRLRPDLITYPLPAFSGEAALPSTLDVFINDTRRDSLEIAPGPYTVTNLPVVTGAGEALLVTTDAQGRRVANALPFYVVNDLLAPGLSSYSASLGAVRRRYGQADFDYGPLALTGAYRRGVTDAFTLELQGESSKELATLGAGGVFRLWHWGSFETAYRQSRFENTQGQAISAGYRYQGRRFNLGLRHTSEDDAFMDVSTLQTTRHRQGRDVTQITTGAALGGVGNLAAGYFDIGSGDDRRTRLVNLTYSRALFGRLNLTLSANRELEGDWNTLAQLTLPLQRHGVVSSSIERSARGETSTRVSYGRAAPLHGGVGWSLASEARQGRSDYHQADLTWRGPHVQLAGGVHGDPDAPTYWVDAQGSLVHMDQRWFAAQAINDSFVVVSTDGQPDVPVRYENQLVGHTDRHGHLLVPWTTAYYAGRYAIDPLALAATVRVPDVERRVAVHAKSGHLVRFAATATTAAQIALVDTEGAPLPLGALATLSSGGVSRVGWDGLVYFEDMAPRTTLTVELPNGGACQTDIVLPPQQDQIHQLGPLACR